MNTALQRAGIQYRVNSGLGLTLCILAILSFGIVPIMFVAFFIVSIFFLKSVKNGAIALLKQGG